MRLLKCRQKRGILIFVSGRRFPRKLFRPQTKQIKNQINFICTDFQRFSEEKGGDLEGNYACCRYVSRFFILERKVLMETRVALIGIVVENLDSVERLNSLLHDYGQYIIGRMGIPYEKKGVSIISVAVDAPQDAINALTGKLGAIDGVTAKTIYSKLGESK